MITDLSSLSNRRRQLAKGERLLPKDEAAKPKTHLIEFPDLAAALHRENIKALQTPDGVAAICNMHLRERLENVFSSQVCTSV
jgi:hypothetical protein